MSAARRVPLLNPAQTAFVECLKVAAGGDATARVFLQAALRAARRTAVPREPDEIVAFVRAFLLPALVEDLGEHTARTFLDEVVAGVGGEAASTSRLRSSRPSPSVPESSGVREVDARAIAPRSRPALRLLVGHPDRSRRAILARQLVAAGCEVVLVESAGDLAQVVDVPQIALLDLGIPDIRALLATLRARRADVRVLGTLALGCDADALFDEAGIARFDTVLPGIRGPELLDRLHGLLGGSPA